MGYNDGNGDGDGNQNGSSGADDILEVFIWIFIGFVVIMAIAGGLDHVFGWGLTPWVWSLVRQATGGAIG